MATAEQMAAYTQQLLSHTSALNKPVTELSIFKLNPIYAEDHAAAATEFETHVIEQTAPGKPFAKGIRKISWGFSINDPETFVWFLDWEKIQDHWDFWQTPGFPPVMGTISKLFVPGRPLVRHYDFGQPGMLDETFVRLFVWDAGEKEGTPEELRAKALATGTSKIATNTRQANAVDKDEMTWYCLSLGYKDEASARKEEVHPNFKGEDHVVNLKFLGPA